MIAGSQPNEEGVVADAGMPAPAIAAVKRGCRHSPRVAVKFQPAVEFGVPIFYEFESGSCLTEELT